MPLDGPDAARCERLHPLTWTTDEATSEPSDRILAQHQSGRVRSLADWPARYANACRRTGADRPQD